MDIKAEIARIDKQREEMLKLSKRRGDPWLFVLVGFLSIVAALIARLPEILAAFGLHG